VFPDLCQVADERRRLAGSEGLGQVTADVGVDGTTPATESSRPWTRPRGDAGPPPRWDNEAFEVGFRVECM
jgi:hypothetical protein